ncbi:MULTISPECIES: molybdopterin-dependent oxidoreductase [unclassified Streptomyces]|uniref:molybdopterin-dependent oxidoreductase n=1 Tax=unclassified Streptomyces TaxID=2593676 RepID=UPI002E33F06B|nr:MULTISPECIES: molybdopterin-dependent oxidoreductase [unclassified Streptomyces]WUC67670.1 molybdopterin-dependent oxidoreductase [Streptomyces sp. NBC_00539]
MRIDRATFARTAPAALSGLLSGYAALAVAELVAAAVRPEAGPVTAVGGAAVDRTPSALKDWAIRHFGSDDKLVLQLGILAVLALTGVVLGLLALRHRRCGCAGVLLLGLVGGTAAVTRPDSTGPADALPSLVGALAAAALLYVLTGRAAAAPGAVFGAAQSRRRFLLAAGSTAVASTAAGVFGRRLGASRVRDAAASRAAVRLPAPASPAPAVPRGASLRIPGISPFTTPGADFYRVDTALVVPAVPAGTWRLRVHGKGVGRPRTYSYADLLGRPLIERDLTLTCVSNEVGGPYVGTARWLGVRLADLLAEAGVRPPSKGGPADQLVARSVDGMTLGTPVEAVMDGRDAMLAVGMNGEPLPLAHGFPVRMLVPGLYGYVSACKWIEDIELTTFASYDPYWVRRNWAREASVKTQARIDTPRPFARPAPGVVMVAGVAWAQHRGIDRVEVRVDDGPWEPADLAAEHTADTWRQWSYRWQAVTGGHTLTVRATDRSGTTQTEERKPTIPDGASGRHSVVVSVG